MTTLDGTQRALQESDIVIADERGPIALAGVMGGAETEVSAATTTVVLETATFDPRSIRRTSKRLGSSQRGFAPIRTWRRRGGIPHASRRAAAMLVRLGGGAIVGEGVDRHPRSVEPARVSLSFAGLKRLAGFEIPLAQASAKLGSIGIATSPDKNAPDERLVAVVPTFRPDITIEQDLVEEVMRLVGYDKAPDAPAADEWRARRQAPRGSPIGRATRWRRSGCTKS